jgi:hypothetical protein
MRYNAICSDNVMVLMGKYKERASVGRNKSRWGGGTIIKEVVKFERKLNGLV